MAHGELAPGARRAGDVARGGEGRGRRGGAPARSKKIGVTSMKRLCRFLVTALKVTLGFFVWLFLAVFKWVIRQWSFACLGNYSLSRT